MPGPQPCRCYTFIFYIVGRGLDPSAAFRRRQPPRGVGDAAPYSGNPHDFTLPPSSPAAWGQAALHLTLSQLAGRGALTPPQLSPKNKKPARHTRRVGQSSNLIL